MFLVLSSAFLYFSVTQLYSSVASSSAEYLTRTWLINWVNSPVQFLLIYQFVVYFVVTKTTRWQTYVLVGGYVFIAATNWIPLLVDPSFVVTTPHLTPTGLIAGLGTDAPYLIPDNINLFVTAMAILSFYLLFRYYRSDKSLLVRGQIKYLTMGIALILIGSYVHFISSSYPSLPNLQNLIAGGGDFILFLGLRRKGFYSVTPISGDSRPGVAGHVPP